MTNSGRDKKYHNQINKMRALAGKKPITSQDWEEEAKSNRKLRVSKLFEPRVLNPEIFEILDLSDKWEIVLWAERIKHKKIKSTLDQLLDKIYKFSIDWGEAHNGLLLSEYGNLKKNSVEVIPLEVTQARDELQALIKKDLRTSNYYFYTFVVIAYFIFLAFSAGSILPDNLISEFKHHIATILFLIKYIVGLAIIISSIIAGVATYYYFEKKINRWGAKATLYFTLIYIASVATSIASALVLFSGIKATFHVDVLSSMTNSEQKLSVPTVASEVSPKQDKNISQNEVEAIVYMSAKTYKESGISGLTFLSKEAYKALGNNPTHKDLKKCATIDMFSNMLDSGISTKSGFPLQDYFTIKSFQERIFPYLKRMGLTMDEANRFLNELEKEVRKYFANSLYETM